MSKRSSEESGEASPTQSVLSNTGTSDDLECPYKLGSGDRAMLQGELLPIIEGHLYLTCASSSAAIQPKKRELWIMLKERSASYVPLCAEFGPLDLGKTHRMCKKLHALLTSPEHGRTKIIFCTSTEPTDITNAIALLGAFLCLRMGYTVAQALRPFLDLHHSLIIPFRDATWGESTFDLHVGDCLAGLNRAVSAGIFKQTEFSVEDYFFYSDRLRGDMHEVLPGKFIAFRGPMRDHGREDNFERVVERGVSTLSASDYLDAFKDKNVSTIICLDAIQYSADVFKRAGFTHFDLPFEDCEVPSDSIVDKFLRIAEEARGVVAVYCSSGRGRTGTLIALYLMKHHGFTAREAMGWLRICRPGSVIGPQQHYLEQQQKYMHMLGGQGCPGPGCALDMGAIEDDKKQRNGDWHPIARRRIVQVGEGACIASGALSDIQDTHLFVEGDLLLSFDGKVGEGSTGTVYRGILCSEVEVAVKVIHEDMDEDEKKTTLADLRQEIAIGKMIPTHPNLPVFVGWCATQSRGPMVMWKLINGHNLHEVFAMHRMRWKEKHVWRPKEEYVISWSRQLFSALACLHYHGFMHRDVKPDNIMMDEQHKLIVLVDFGLCRTISTANGENVRCMTGNTGTYRFMAPEVSRKEQYNAKVDVYSGSMVVCFMLFGDMPFPKIPGFAVSQLMERENLRPNLTSCKNKDLAKLLTRAWDKNPHLRPHAHEMEAELRILHDDLIRRKENCLSSKVSSAFSSASDSFRRLGSLGSIPRASSSGKDDSMHITPTTAFGRSSSAHSNATEDSQASTVTQRQKKAFSSLAIPFYST